MRWLFLVVALLLASTALADEGPAEATVSTSNTSAASSKLSVGWKHIVCDTSTHMRTGGSSVAATTSDLSIVGWDLYIGGNELYIAFILDSSTGSCKIFKLTPGPTGVPPSHATNSDITPTSVTTGVVSATLVAATSVTASSNITAGGGIQAVTGPVYVGNGATTGGLITQDTALIAVDGVTNGAVTIGATNATSTTIGRSGQTTSINGNVSFGTTGPSLGGTVTGAWSVFGTGLLTAATNYGAFQADQSVNNVRFRNVSCTHSVAGAGTAGTLAIRNVTDASTLCSGSYTCTTTANTPTLIFDCAASPVAGKMYALNFTTGCSVTQVTGLNCNIEIAH